MRLGLKMRVSLRRCFTAVRRRCFTAVVSEVKASASCMRVHTCTPVELLVTVMLIETKPDN
jgi:hypothetical protein